MLVDLGLILQCINKMKKILFVLCLIALFSCDKPAEKYHWGCALWTVTPTDNYKTGYSVGYCCWNEEEARAYERTWLTDSTEMRCVKIIKLNTEEIILTKN